MEIDETNEGLLLKPFNPVAEMKGFGKGVFGDPVKYQKKLRRLGRQKMKISLGTNVLIYFLEGIEPKQEKWKTS